MPITSYVSDQGQKPFMRYSLISHTLFILILYGVKCGGMPLNAMASFKAELILVHQWTK